MELLKKLWKRIGKERTMVEVMPTGSVVLDTQKEIAWYRFMVGFQALWIEANSGFKVNKRFSPVKFFGKYGFRSKRLKPLLEEVKNFLQEQNAIGEIPKEVFTAVQSKSFTEFKQQSKEVQ